MTLKLTGKRLDKLGYKTDIVTSSTKALDIVRLAQDNVDLIITDQTMPSLTGEQLSQKLLNIRPDLPIIICTGYSEKMNAAKAAAIGISAFLLKPIDYRELATVVRNVLDRI